MSLTLLFYNDLYLNIKNPKIYVLVHLSEKFPFVLERIIRLTRNDYWVNDCAAQYQVWSRYQISYSILHNMSSSKLLCHIFLYFSNRPLCHKEIYLTLMINDLIRFNLMSKWSVFIFDNRQYRFLHLKEVPLNKIILGKNRDIDNTWYSSTCRYFTTFFFDTSWKHIFSTSAHISASFFYQKSWFEAFSFCLRVTCSELHLFYNVSEIRRNFQYVFLVFSNGVVLYHSLSLFHLIVSDLLPYPT